jgi:hypothetical protein
MEHWVSVVIMNLVIHQCHTKIHNCSILDKGQVQLANCP